jgi:ATP-dependent Clp protease adaptor protein ClpS
VSVAPVEVDRPDTDRLSETVVETDRPWITLVWNDPVNLMTYVTFVFQEYFGYSREKATRLMMQVHEEGRAVVATGSREEMERDVTALHGYGLWATLQQDT